MKTALVCGSAGFIGGHLVRRLKSEGYNVIGADIQDQQYEKAHLFYPYDLRNRILVSRIFSENKIDEVYQLAADMGGAGFVFTGEHDAEIMYNSAQINLNVLEMARLNKVDKIFYSSSACMYPEYNQLDPDNPKCSEDSAYPAAPDSEYGWEKLFSERLYMAYARNYGMNVRIARFHNIFGPEGTYDGGREKAPAAICRKVAQSNGGIVIWGDGKATRSFLYVDECVEGIRRLMESDYDKPINIGSDEMVSVERLAEMVIEISGKQVKILHDRSKPQGVRGRNSDNALTKQVLSWSPSAKLYDGLVTTYSWINKQVNGQVQ